MHGVSHMVKLYMNTYFHLSKKQQGSTLLEVLVSVFILGFGLLALVSMQLKTVGTAREAENQTIVAQAADALVEGMVMNPDRAVGALTSGDKVIERSFARYTALSGKAATCTDDTSLAADNITKDALAAAQVCTFVKRLDQIPKTGKVYWNICSELTENTTVKPVLEGNTVKCGAAGTHTVLKVIWEQELENPSSYTGSGLTLNAAGNAVLYSYQTPIGQ